MTHSCPSPITILSSFFFVPMAAMSLLADEVFVTWDASLADKYVDRGLLGGNVTLQTGVEASQGDVYGGIWSMIPLEDRGAPQSFSDAIDIYAGYGWAAGGLTAFDAGMTLQYVEDGDSSVEAYLGAYRELGTLTPSLYLFRDLRFDRTTLELSTGVNFPMESIPFEVSFFLGRVEEVGDRDYTYFGTDVYYPVELSNRSSLRLGVRYANNTYWQIDEGDHLYGTASFDLSF